MTDIIIEDLDTFLLGEEIIEESGTSVLREDVIEELNKILNLPVVKSYSNPRYRPKLVCYFEPDGRVLNMVEIYDKLVDLEAVISGVLDMKGVKYYWITHHINQLS